MVMAVLILPIPLLVTRPDGTVVRFNDAAARTFDTEKDISRVHMLGEGAAAPARHIPHMLGWNPACETLGPA